MIPKTGKNWPLILPFRFGEEHAMYLSLGGLRGVFPVLFLLCFALFEFPPFKCVHPV